MSPDQLRDELNAKRLEELRGIARAFQIPAYSSAPKALLIERLLQGDRATLINRLKAPATPNQDQGQHSVYQPAPWEKICAVATAVLVVLLVVFLVVRNQPFNDPNLVILMRIVLSTAVAVLGATIPGFLHVDLSVRGVIIRAGGALALFVLTFFYSPTVLPPPVGPPPDGQGRPPFGSVKVDVGSSASGSRIDPDGRVQKVISSYQPVSNEYDEHSGEVEKCPPDRTLTFTYAREADVPHISYTMPYLELMRKGGPILGVRYGNSPFQWQFPNLSVKVVNTTSQEITLSEAKLEVLSSTVIDEPVLVVDDLSVNKIALVNEGWGDVVNPVVTFGVNDVVEGGGVSTYEAEPHTEAIPTFTDGAAIPIKPYIPARLQDDDKVMVEGRIVYGAAASRKTVRFKTRVALEIIPKAAPPPSYLYEVHLKAGVTPQTVLVPTNQVIDKSDNFLIRVATDKSARFKLRVSFREVGGGMVPANDLLLDIFVPRSQAKYSTQKPK